MDKNTEVLINAQTLQGIITRMADNSIAYKKMCLTIIVVLWAASLMTGKPGFVILGFAVMVMIAYIDMCFLVLERGFRNDYNVYMKKVSGGNWTPSDIFQIRPVTINAKLLRDASSSLAITPFYTVLVLTNIVFVFHFLLQVLFS